jgi:glycyl-tRNA synthetase
VDNFSDPMIDNKDSQKRYRVDHLIEAYADELEAAGKKDQADELLASMDSLLAKSDFDGLKKLIEEKKIKCSISGTANWSEVRQFNLMFSTQLGSLSEEASEIYLRPETAQGIFVNFLNVQKTGV